MEADVTDKQRRKELSDRFEQASAEGGVYRILNRESGRFLLGSARNLAGMRNRFEFARSTDAPNALDPRLREDADRFGLEAFSFEVVDTIEIPADRTPSEAAEELSTLEGLWREKADSSLHY